MKEENLKARMETKSRKDGKKYIPLFVTLVNGSYIVAAYQGSISEFDIIINIP